MLCLAKLYCTTSGHLLRPCWPCCFQSLPLCSSACYSICRGFHLIRCTIQNLWSVPHLRVLAPLFWVGSKCRGGPLAKNEFVWGSATPCECQCCAVKPDQLCMRLFHALVLSCESNHQTAAVAALGDAARKRRCAWRRLQGLCLRLAFRIGRRSRDAAKHRCRGCGAQQRRCH